MIKENEIRVGNKVLVNNIIVTIKSINFNPVNNEYYVGVFENSSQYLIALCFPIPLTEEILLKCGFEYQDDLGIFFKGLFEIQKLRLGIDLRERFEAMLYDFNPSLDYLHQLQNIHFVLTGTELIYKNN